MKKPPFKKGFISLLLQKHKDIVNVKQPRRIHPKRQSAKLHAATLNKVN